MSSGTLWDVLDSGQADADQPAGNSQAPQPWRSRRVAARQQAEEEDKENAPPVDNESANESISYSRIPLADITSQTNALNFGQPCHDPAADDRAQSISFASAPDSAIKLSSGPSSQPKVDEDGFTVVESRSHRRAARRQESAFPDSNNDWRAPHPNAAPTHVTRHHLTFPSGPRTKDHGVWDSDQRPGMIVRHLDMRPSTDPNAKLGDPGVVMGPDGKLWMMKSRNWGILAQHGETVTEAPIYTYNNNGLANKPVELWGEYLSIKPLRAAEVDFVNQSPSNPLLKIGNEFTRELTRNTMVLKYTDLQTRRMACDELLKVAEFDAESTEILKAYAAKALMG